MTNQTRPNSGNQFSDWIHELARVESSPEAEVLDRLNQSSGPQQAIEENTVEFLTDLRVFFQEYTRIFNALSEGGKKYSELKIFNLTQGAADFMLYRNGVKLIVANTAHGVIQISYDQHRVAGAPASTIEIPQSEDLLAQMGVFGSVYWTYRGERVQSDQVSKYFFSEFTRLTRDQKKTKPNQKILLEQIKVLLQEQGLSLD